MSGTIKYYIFYRIPQQLVKLFYLFDSPFFISTLWQHSTVMETHAQKIQSQLVRQNKVLYISPVFHNMLVLFAFIVGLSGQLHCCCCCGFSSFRRPYQTYNTTYPIFDKLVGLRDFLCAIFKRLHTVQLLQILHLFTSIYIFPMGCPIHIHIFLRFGQCCLPFALQQMLISSHQK